MVRNDRSRKTSCMEETNQKSECSFGAKSLRWNVDPGTPIPEVNDNPIFQGQLKQAQLEFREALRVLSIQKLIVFFAGKNNDRHWHTQQGIDTIK